MEMGFVLMFVTIGLVREIGLIWCFNAEGSEGVGRYRIR